MLILPLGLVGEAGIYFLTLSVALVCILLYALGGAPLAMSLAFDPSHFSALKILSCVFVHAGLLHLAGNLFFLVCFASAIELRTSAAGYALLFLIFAVVSNLAYFLSTRHQVVVLPTLGISGVVWGFMALLLCVRPLGEIHTLVWFFLIIRRIEVPVGIFVLAYLAFDISAYRHGSSPGINHVAHLAGAGAGVACRVLVWPFIGQPPKELDARPAVRKRPRLR